MYRIERTPYGLKLIFDGSISSEEASLWLDEATEVLSRLTPPFRVLVDMTGVTDLASGGKKVFVRGQHHFRKAGMERSAVVLQDAVIRARLQHMARQSGIGHTERYFDARSQGVRCAVVWLLDRNVD